MHSANKAPANARSRARIEATHYFVVVVVLLVEPVTPPVEPLLDEPLPDEPEPDDPMELVLPPLLDGLPLAVLPDEPMLLPLPLPDGLVLELLVDPEPAAPEEPVAPSRLLQALSERAATTARVAAAHCVRDVFIRKLLEGCLKFASRNGQS